MPYKDRVNQREAQRQYRKRKAAKCPDYVEAERVRRRSYNHTENGMASNRRCNLRWAKRQARKDNSTIFFQTIEHSKSMSATLTNKTTQTQARRFADLIQQGIDAWSEAGRLLVRMLEDDPRAKDVILSECPDLTSEVLARFEAIGRKQLHPKTLLDNSPGMRRLRRLPYSEQERYLQEPVPVVIRKGDAVDVLNVAVKNLSREQVTQAIAASGIRTPEAQRAWIESKRADVVRVKKPYKIQKGRVTFTSGCTLSSAELARIVTLSREVK